MAYFAEMVSRETQGRVTVKIYYNGSLGTPTEIIEQVKFGGIAMARVNVLELSEEVESIRKYFVPSNFAGGDAQTEWIHSNEETLRDECQMDRITPLVWYYLNAISCRSASLPPMTEGRSRRSKSSPRIQTLYAAVQLK
mgnify:CR=1 FL=1